MIILVTIINDGNETHHKLNSTARNNEHQMTYANEQKVLQKVEVIHHNFFCKHIDKRQIGDFLGKLSKLIQTAQRCPSLN